LFSGAFDMAAVMPAARGSLTPRAQRLWKRVAGMEVLGRRISA